MTRSAPAGFSRDLFFVWLSRGALSLKRVLGNGDSLGPWPHHFSAKSYCSSDVSLQDCLVRICPAVLSSKLWFASCFEVGPFLHLLFA